jgi:ATP-dependent DNA helicase RecG
MSTTTTAKLLDLSELSVQYFKGIGPQVTQRLAKMGLHTAQDVLFHLPYRYQDRTRITPINWLRVGEHAVIEGQILRHQVQYGKRRSLVCTLKDSSGLLTLRFFNFNASQVEQFAKNPRVRCFGEARFNKSGLQLIHPEYQILTPDASITVEEHFTPVYPSTEGISQRQLQLLTAQVFALCKTGNEIREYLPAEIRQELNMPALKEAIEFLHYPPPDTALELLEQGLHPSQQRLIIEELLAYQLSMQRLRQRVQQQSAQAFTRDDELLNKFISNLPFSLTGAQQRVWQEIQNDLAKSQPMLRLVQGDVGAGKTVVAALAALQAVANGYQVALMAPTEILAEQHYQQFLKWFTPLNIQVDFLKSKLTAKDKRATYAALAQGDSHVVIGTHALVQEQVGFAKLGLVIIDEQHRFGVDQRLALVEKGIGERTPHQLIMTATPIPRTLAMSIYSHLDCSSIDELPPGRQPITTVAIADSRRDEVVARVREICKSGQQVYWVCTLIEESEAHTTQAAEKTTEYLTEQLSELKIGLVHGRLTPAAKSEVMESFKKGETQVLVATTVIEVGVHVANASLMIIENPERLGLAQLHQLRGRVGRGNLQSHCVLMYQQPLSQMARERLDVLRKTGDGFIIAEKDLQLRGPGEVLGTKQTGLARLRIANLVRDQHLLPRVQQLSQRLLSDYPDFVEPLIQRWLQENEQYGGA